MNSFSHFRADATVWCSVIFSILAVGAPSPAQQAKECDGVDEFLRRWQHAVARKMHRAAPRPPDDTECRDLVPCLRKMLLESEPQRKTQVLSVIEWMYPSSDGMAAAILETLKDSDAKVRATAAKTLSTFVLDANAVIGPLSQRLSDRDAFVREMASFALGNMGVNGNSARSELERSYEHDKNVWVQAAALEALVRVDRPRAWARILDAMGSDVPEIRRSGVWSLRWVRNADLDLEVLRPKLHAFVMDDGLDSCTRSLAFREMARRPAYPAKMGEMLAAMFKTSEDAHKSGMRPSGYSVRRPWKEYRVDLALEALGVRQQWQLAPHEITELVRTGIVGDHRFRSRLIQIYRNSGSVDPEITPHLLEIGILAKGWERRYAFLAAASDPSSYDALLDLLSPLALTGSYEAVELIGHCGPNALPVLSECFREATVTRPALVNALLVAGDTPLDVLDHIVEIVKDAPHTNASDSAHRAARALAQAGDEGIARLLSLLETEYPRAVRHAALDGLAWVDGCAVEAIPTIIALLRDAAPVIHVRARKTLAKIGPPAMPFLLPVLESDDVRDAQHAAFAIEGIGHEASAWTDEVFDAWCMWLRSDRRGASDVSRQVGQALVKIGPAAISRILPFVLENDGRDRDRGIKLLKAIGYGRAPDSTQLFEKAAKELPEQSWLRVILMHSLPDNEKGQTLALRHISDPEPSVQSAAISTALRRGWYSDPFLRAITANLNSSTYTATLMASMRKPIPNDARRRLADALCGIASSTSNGSSDLDYPALLRNIVSLGAPGDCAGIVTDAFDTPNRKVVLAVCSSFSELPWNRQLELAPLMGRFIKTELENVEPDVGLARRVAQTLREMACEWPGKEQLCTMLMGTKRPHFAALGVALCKHDGKTNTAGAAARLLASRKHCYYYSNRVEMRRMINQLCCRADPRAVPILRILATEAPEGAARWMAKDALTTLLAGAERPQEN